MKPHRLTNLGNPSALPARSFNDRLAAAGNAVASIGGYALVALLLLLTAALSVQAQSLDFRAMRPRVTVPVSTTNTDVITVHVVATNHATPINLAVNGLPAGAGYTLTDTNGTPTTQVAVGTYNITLWLTLYTTNIAEGVHNFTMDGTGGAATSLDLVLQSAHVWNGANGAVPPPSFASVQWSTASNWLGAALTAGSDVVFGDRAAQTNFAIFTSGNLPYTNSVVDANTWLSSLRFSQTGETNAPLAGDTNTPPRDHHLLISPGVSLVVTGAQGFSLLRDYVDDWNSTNAGSTYGAMNVRITGGAGAKLVVSNDTANFAFLPSAQSQSVLNMTNLQRLEAYVNRFAIAEYQVYPNYSNYNNVNGYGRFPRRFDGNLYLARTNHIKASFVGPDNYTNENTRAYAFSFMNNETAGIGSSVNHFFFFGYSNGIYADSVCLIGANSATGNGGLIGFRTNSSTAVFRSPSGGRMSIFSIADGGGTTNRASSNVKGTVDFAGNNGLVDILADRFVVGWDRSMIASNDNPTFEGTLFFGRGTMDINTAIIGYQEHDTKTDWTTIGGAQIYRGYSRGTLTVTNGGTFRVNGNLILGYTADTNPVSSAEQFNTYGRITAYTNCTVSANNIIADGGLNYYDTSLRQNNITFEGGTLIVSNQMGALPGLPIDNLSMSGATLVLNLDASRTNVYVRNLQNPGATPTTIKIASVTGVGSYPVQLPLISYELASPYLVANVTSLGAGYNAYVLDNDVNKTVDVYITTNSPNSLLWVGNINNTWDTTTKNWVTVAGGLQTNFTLGDQVRFDDSSSVNNINISGSVVPGQSGAGVTVSNSTSHNYTFSGGTVLGTSLLLKQGNGTLTVTATKQGPVTIEQGTVTGFGTIGVTTVASNAVLNYSGFVNGGLTSTGSVTLASGSILNGPVSIQGGSFSNSGIVSTAPGGLTIGDNATLVNTALGTMNVSGGNWTLPATSTLANFGTINSLLGRINFNGTFYGNGAYYDPNGGLTSNPDARVSANPLGLLSPGASLYNSIATMYLGARLDFNNTPATAPNGHSTFRIEVDFSNPQTNDIITADVWNNITGMILMTNINPGAGSFAAGQAFQVLQNNNGPGYENPIDVNGTYPLMWPALPGPGLQWGLFDFRKFGLVTVTNTGLVWDGTPSGAWDTATANWQGGKTYGDNQGALFNDSAAGTTTITLNEAVAPSGYAINTNIVVGVSTNYFTNGPVMSPGIVFENSTKDYTISGSGKISGITGLYKSGSGTLWLLTSNDFSGNIILLGGTLAFSNNPSGASVTALSFGGSGIFNNREILIDGATLKYAGITNANLNNYLDVQENGATVEVTYGYGTNTLRLDRQIVGPGSLTKTGPGALMLAQGANAFQGGTFLNQGLLGLSDRALGYGGLTIANGTVIDVTAAFNLTNALSIPSGSATVMLRAGGIYSGPLSGSGSLTISNVSPNQYTFNSSLDGFSGSLSFGPSTGSYRFNNSTNNNPNTGSATAAFDLGTATATLSNLNGGGLTYNLGALSGGSGTILGGRITNSAVWPASTIYSIGAKGSSTAFNGQIANGNGDVVSVVKVGAGTLALNGANTFTGMTTVSNGTLGGSGSLAGPLTVETGGTFAPGNSVGTFTVGGAVVLKGATVMELDRTAATFNDRLVASSVTGGGTLTVNNIGPNLVNGSVFHLFSTAVSGFTSVTLPATSPGGSPYTWINNLAVDGSIQLSTGGVPTTPTNAVSQRTGTSTMTVSWPANYTGWSLVTNAVALETMASSNWFVYPGSDLTNLINLSIDPSKTNVFFRMNVVIPQ